MGRITIDLNSDLGESVERVRSGEDAALMEFVTSANIACGGHAGDEETMREMVRAALARGVNVGAHPGYPDRAGFGRVRMDMGAEEVERAVGEQVEALALVANAEGAAIVHVKAHGALYHVAMRDRGIAEAVGRGAGRVGRPILVGQAGAAALEWWREMEFPVSAEAFADRGYEADGKLAARGKPGSVISDPEKAAERAVEIALGRGVKDSTGQVIRLSAQTICIHSDTPGSLENARAIGRALAAAGVEVRRFAAG
jgi:UPF0271 protein